ncbi:hypothetical protein [Hymenobacter coalescens]
MPPARPAAPRRYLGVPRSLVHPQRLFSLSAKLSTAWRLTKRLLKT